MSGDELHSFQHNHIVKSVDFSADSSLFVTGSNEKLLRIFDLNKPEAGVCSESLVSILLPMPIVIMFLSFLFLNIILIF